VSHNVTSDPFDSLFIFELANNHQGSLDHGKRIIDAAAAIAARHGVRGAVKFQYRDLGSFLHKRIDEWGNKHASRFRSTRLADTEFAELVRYSKQAGLVSVCTPFDESSVRLAVDHGNEILKVASCSANDWPLLEEISRTGYPVICSTGGCTLEAIDRIVSFLRHREVRFALMHCVAEYPTSPDRVQLGFMSRLARRYAEVPVGYSGHEAPDNTDIVRCAVAMGARLLERHLGVPLPGAPNNSYSMDPSQADAWVRTAVDTRRMTSGIDEERQIAPAERDSLDALARGAYLRRPVKAGATVTADDVYFAMPCRPGQTTSGLFSPSRASKDYAADDALTEAREHDPVAVVRTHIHRARGLLSEAGIHLLKPLSIEISHHYGIDQFHRTGAILVNVVNRTYCKKLLVMMPGQTHPLHHHRVKDETFIVLWGRINIRLGDQHLVLAPGDQLIVEPGVVHGFATETGCIFEELSTTQLPQDSVYVDPAIQRLDPMKRKTILESW
jgi:sialic acid synthase SpsE/mannose-6-phosphate isomerase-like protein (cupin superfamily)